MKYYYLPATLFADNNYLPIANKFYYFRHMKKQHPQQYYHDYPKLDEVFEDVANLPTFLIPRFALQKLPDYIIHNFGFYYDAGENT